MFEITPEKARLMIAFIPMYILLYSCIFPCVMGYNITDIQRLKQDLLINSGYDKSIRPVVNQSQVLEIQIAFAVTSIVDFDIVSGRFQVTGYLFASWTDEQLLWNPLLYNGLQSVVLSKDLVWTPGLRNAFEMDDSFKLSRLVVYANGIVTWLPPSTFFSLCVVDITYYPYDEHTCQFPFFSSTDDATTIRFVPMATSVNLNNFNDHGYWEVVSTTAGVVDVKDSNIQLIVSSFVASLFLRRRPRFAMLHTYFPLMLLYSLNMLSFWVPMDEGERVSYSITLMLALVFFTSNISAAFPQSSLKTSYFSITMALATCASALCVVISVILVKLDSETLRPVPAWLRYLTVRLKMYRREGCQCCRDKNTVQVVNEYARDDEMPDNTSYKEMKNTDQPELESVTWAEAAEALNKFLFWIYAVLLVTSVTVLIILHHVH